ncbi:MAG: hypothetical protein L0Y72_06065 [Gemmataceae bacterium]|nr:hypothetical protein [Gemmataceae bacterium]MCI0738591.1 hypothetical protein [Gemmataceae bacterium]
MQFQFDIATHPAAAPVVPAGGDINSEFLRQLLEVQRESVQVQREQLTQARAVAQDNLGRWRTLLGRWQETMPMLPEHCRLAYPVLEKAYVHILSTMVEELAEQEDDALGNDFAVQEFIDRYGMRIGQLSHLLNVVGSMAEAAQQNEAAASAEEKSS